MNIVQEQRTTKIQSVQVNNDKGYLICKRIVDIIGASIGLLVLSVLFIVVIIAIKVEDPKGPIFFSQLRVGIDGKEFRMFKFRSMVFNAEGMLQKLVDKNEVAGAMFKMKNDPRITKVGKVIRKTSIDELPQLVNVLLGHMSLVGPRPPLPREVEVYSAYERQRLLVQPGCTGLWQVSGRNSLGFTEMVELDLKYIAKRTIAFDILIIVKTFKEVIAPKGAY
ncbi:sugar transferase [Rossellomorea marisflavi]|uniref:sugar transferase n=1 Tax=Rossellomorea marisflavi TaxID=189381 RepID=UPI00345943A9